MAIKYNNFTKLVFESHRTQNFVEFTVKKECGEDG